MRLGGTEGSCHLLPFTDALTGQLQPCTWGTHHVNKQSETHKCSVRVEELNTCSEENRV